jgi:hypothetical protein
MRVHRNHLSVLNLRYEQLKTDTEQTIREVCRFLNLDFRPEMLQVPFRPNTSFPESSSSSDYLTRTQRIWIRFLSACFRWWPLAGFAAVRWFHRLFADPTPQMYGVSFHMLREERGLPSDSVIAHDESYDNPGPEILR